MFSRISNPLSFNNSLKALLFAIVHSPIWCRFREWKNNCKMIASPSFPWPLPLARPCRSPLRIPAPSHWPTTSRSGLLTPGGATQRFNEIIYIHFILHYISIWLFALRYKLFIHTMLSNVFIYYIIPHRYPRRIPKTFPPKAEGIPRGKERGRASSSVANCLPPPPSRLPSALYGILCGTPGSGTG